MALDKLEAYIGECPDRRTEIMKLAWLLGSDECHQKKGWTDLANKFFDKFRPEILTWCGFDLVDPWKERVPVNDRKFLSDLLGQMKDIFSGLEDILSGLSGQSELTAIILKALGVCIVAELGSQCCRDAGETAIAAKVELAAKAALVMMSMPVFASLLEMAGELLRL